MTTDDDPDVVLLAALLGGANYDEAGALAGVSPSTVFRRMADGGFRSRLARLRSDVLSRCADRLAALASKALDALEAVLDDPQTPPSQRVSAAWAVLDSALKYRADTDLEARVAAVEAALEQRIAS